jgi:hypothetical protein
LPIEANVTSGSSGTDGGSLGLLQELGDQPGLVGRDAAERLRLGARHADARHGDARAALDVRREHLARVHAVHVVGAEHHDVVGHLVVDEVEALEDRVGAAGVPPAAEPLLRRHRGDVLPEQARQPPRRGDVPVEAVRLVLREHADTVHPRVDEVGEHEIDQPVVAAERHRGLRAVGR